MGIQQAIELRTLLNYCDKKQRHVGTVYWEADMETRKAGGNNDLGTWSE